MSHTQTIEASGAGRSKLDVLLINLGIYTEVTDNYIECRIPVKTGHFLDISSLAFEMSISVTKIDGPH